MTTMTPKSGVEITHYFHELVSHRQRKMILSMGAGQLYRFVVKSVALYTGSAFQ